MTIGVDFEVKSMDINAKKVKLQIWDFGGEERFRFLLPTYVRGANGALFMYDVTNYSSLAHIDDWLLVVRREIKTEQDTFPIIVVGGKADLIDDREVTGDEGINIARSRAVDGFIECSSKTGENIHKIFDRYLIKYNPEDTGRTIFNPNTPVEQFYMSLLARTIQIPLQQKN